MWLCEIEACGVFHNVFDDVINALVVDVDEI